MKTNRNLLGEILPVLTVAVLFGVILLLVVFGATGYHGATERKDANDNMRAVLTYTVTAVRGNTGTVAVEERGGASLLKIADGETGYEQQIYKEGGAIYTAYVKAGTEPHPEDAVRIGETDRFEAGWQRDDLLFIRTDEGTSWVRVRSGK